MRDILVLAMHGSPPLDFPAGELSEFFGLHMSLESGAVPAERRAAMEARHSALEEKVVRWPRDGMNDKFLTATIELAEALQRASGLEVIYGFNEFCAPTLAEALDGAAASGARRAMVVTPMMTRGGGHSEHDIPESIELARGRHPGMEYIFAWPFPTDRVAVLLASQAASFVRGGDGSHA